MCTDQVPRSVVTAIRVKSSRSNDSTKGHWYCTGELNSFCHRSMLFWPSYHWMPVGRLLDFDVICCGNNNGQPCLVALSWADWFLEKYLRQILQEGYLDPIAIALHILLTSERWINTQIASLFGRSCHIWALGMARSTLSRPIPPRWLVATSSEM